MEGMNCMFNVVYYPFYVPYTSRYPVRVKCILKTEQNKKERTKMKKKFETVATDLTFRLPQTDRICIRP